MAFTINSIIEEILETGALTQDKHEQGKIAFFLQNIDKMQDALDKLESLNISSSPSFFEEFNASEWHKILSCKSLKNLSILGCVPEKHPAAFKDFLEICKNLTLEKLNISYGNLSAIPVEILEIFAQFNSLKTLEASACLLGENIDVLKNLLNICKKNSLENLDISMNGFIKVPLEIFDIFSSFKFLKNLNLSCGFIGHNPESSKIIKILQNLPLESLNLSANFLENLFINEPDILAPFKLLKDLSIDFNSEHKITPLLISLKNLPLESLNLSIKSLVNFSIEDFNILSQFQSLKHLKINDEGIKANPEAFKNLLLALKKLPLQKLVIQTKQLVLLNDLREHFEIITNFPSLKELELNPNKSATSPELNFNLETNIKIFTALHLKKINIHSSLFNFKAKDNALIEKLLTENYWCTEISIPPTPKMEEILKRNRSLNLCKTLEASKAALNLALPAIKEEEIKKLKQEILLNSKISLRENEAHSLLMLKNLTEQLIQIEKQISIIIQALPKINEINENPSIKADLLKPFLKIMMELVENYTKKTKEYVEYFNKTPREYEEIFSICNLLNPAEPLQKEISLWIEVPEIVKTEKDYFNYFEKIYHANLNSEKLTTSEFLYAFTEALLLLVKSEKLNPVLKNESYQIAFDGFLSKAVGLNLSPQDLPLWPPYRNHFLRYAILKKAQEIFSNIKVQLPLGSQDTFFAKNTSKLEEVSQIIKLLTALPDKADLKDRKKVIEIYEKVAELLATMTVPDDINKTALDNLKILMQAFQPKAEMENVPSISKGNQ